MKPYRIVVTGSRHWTDLHAIAEAIFDVSEVRGVAQVTIIQGGARGADELALKVAVDLGHPHETFSLTTADWQEAGRAAGPKRNRRMLDAGADLVLAFPVGGPAASPGTWDCIRAAVERGVPVRIFPREIG